MADTKTSTGADIVTLVEQSPSIVLLDEEKFDHFYERVKEETSTLEVDLSTKKGREAIASMAYKVARTKTAIDDAGKQLTAEAREKIKQIDDARRKIREKFDALRDEVRKPLTEWEQAEAERELMAQQQLDWLRRMAQVHVDATAKLVESALEDVVGFEVKESVHGENTGYVELVRAETIESLTSIAARLRREEAEREELERLRAEKEERERRDREEAERKAAEEAAKRAEQERLEAEKREAEEAERRRKEAEERERQLREEAAREAEERARQEAEAQREAERQEEARKLAEAQREAEEAKRRERERIEAEERAEQERKAREADQAHRSQIMRAAKEAIMEHAELDEDAAKRVVLAITGGNVPRVTIEF